MIESPQQQEAAAKSDAAVEVSIVIPTLASAERRDLLLRAVRSARASSVDGVCVIVCVNGTRWDGGSIAALEKEPGVELHRLSEASLPKAIAAGRAEVRTPYFGFLDDDDELLPGAVDARLRVLRSKQDCDLVAANGIRRTVAGDVAMLKGLDVVPGNPLRRLFEQNWLPSCGALFRTASVGREYFDDYHAYAEWTWLAFQLAMDAKRVAILDEPTFIVNDTAGSLSKSAAFRSAYLHLYRRMLARNPPGEIRRILHRRISDALHDMSCSALERRALAEAARLHLRSMLYPGGIQYLSYSRHILKAALTRNGTRAT